MKRKQTLRKKNKPNNKTYILLFLLSSFLIIQNGNAQSYIEKAKKLTFIKKDFQQKKSKGIDTSAYINSLTVGVIEILKFDDQEIDEGYRKKIKENKSKDLNAKTKLLFENVTKEIKNYFMIFSDTFMSNQSAICSDSFMYLDRVYTVAKSSQNLAEGTSVMGVGSFIGVSEVEIIEGITKWALNRAQEELMEAFLRDWLEKIQNDPLLKEAFPNSLIMLSTSNLASLIKNTEVWKATFQQDLDQIPNKIPKLTETILEKLDVKISDELQTELSSGLKTITTIFQEVGKGKNFNDIIELLSAKVMNEEVSTKMKEMKDKNTSIINRSLVGLNLFMKTIKTKDGNNDAYVKANEILKLTNEELVILLKLIYPCNNKELKFVFDYSDTDEADFFKHLNANVQKLKIYLAEVSQAITTINVVLNKIELQIGGDQKLSKEQFNSYTLLMFELVESGLEGIFLFTNDTIFKEKVVVYKKLYTKGFKYILQIQQGIKSKEYGKAVLNLVNFVTWIESYIAQEKEQLTLVSKTAKFNLSKEILAIKEQTKDVQIYINTLEKKLTKKLQVKGLEETKEIVLGKFAVFKKGAERFLDDPSKIPSIDFDSYFIFQDDEIIKITKEIAVYELSNLKSSNKELNSFAKLMAGIIAAKNSEDISNSLEASVKRGGYKIKQQSSFTTTLTFFPGLKFGKERVEGTNSTSSSDGCFLGAALPIGIEFTTGISTKTLGAIGFFIQVLDLGAVLNYNLNNDNAEVNSNPEFGFKQVFSPGAFLTLHIKNNPITLGIGASYSPSLREVNSNNVKLKANAIQYGVFVSVDLNVFTIFSSKKKIPPLKN